MKTRIVLAESQKLVREGLRRILEERSDFEVIGEAGHGIEAVELIEDLDPDVALLEHALPRMAAVTVLRRLEAREQPRCGVLSSSQSSSQVREVLRAGASGYLLKNDSPQNLLDAVDAMREGRFYLSPALTQDVVDQALRPGHSVSSGGVHLTQREQEVLQLTAEGLSSREIAGTLGISARTAESHRSRLMSKLGIHKSSGLVRFAIREGLVSA